MPRVAAQQAPNPSPARRRQRVQRAVRAVGDLAPVTPVRSERPRILRGFRPARYSSRSLGAHTGREVRAGGTAAARDMLWTIGRAYVAEPRPLSVRQRAYQLLVGGWHAVAACRLHSGRRSPLGVGPGTKLPLHLRRPLECGRRVGPALELVKPTRCRQGSGRARRTWATCSVRPWQGPVGRGR